MTLRGALWRMMFLMIFLPPPSEPASSDSFPWSGDPNARLSNSAGNTNSTINTAPAINTTTANTVSDTGVHRDAYGALRDNAMLPDTVSNMVRPQNNLETGVIAPGGTVSGSGFAQGNVGPTQSGPGAAGLFTPNSPGNAAAYNAQMSGGLTGSPIVDGTGANLRVSVPTSTPSGVPNYHVVRTNGIDEALRNNALINRNALPVNTQNANVSNGMMEIGNNRASSGRSISVVRTSVINVGRASLHRSVGEIPSTRSRARSGTLSQTLAISTNPINRIGDLTGSITYADGVEVLLGTNGTATIDPHSRTLSLPGGERVSMKKVAGPLRQIAQKNQVRL